MLFCAVALVGPGCGAIDACSATAADFAGHYEVLIDDVVTCNCGERPGDRGDCPTKCRSAIGEHQAVCDAESRWCTYFRPDKVSGMFTIEADGKVRLERFENSTPSQDGDIVCEAQVESFCDLSFTCAGGGLGTVAVTWERVE